MAFYVYRFNTFLAYVGAILLLLKLFPCEAQVLTGKILNDEGRSGHDIERLHAKIEHLAVGHDFLS